MHGVLDPFRRWQVFLSVLVTVAAFRLLWVHLGAGELPYRDQWDSEGWLLYRAYLQGELGLAGLFGPHNEHRILWPRLTALLLFLANNQVWDNLVTASFSALFVATLAASLAHWAKSRLEPALRLPMLLMLVLLACLPVAWENLVSGFQIAFFQMLLFSLLGLGLAVHVQASWRAAVALAALMVAGLFTVASGLLAPVVVACVLAWRIWRGELPRIWLVLAGLLVAVAAVGFYMIPDTPHHDGLKAQSLAELARALMLVLAWPFPTHLPLGLLLWTAPLLWLPTLLRRHRPPSRLVVFALAVSAWIALQALGMAYSRGHDATAIATRYLDLLGLGCLVNLLLWLLWSQSRLGDRIAGVGRVVVPLLYGALAVGFVHAALEGVRSLGEHRGLVDLQTRNVQAYLQTGNAAHLAGRRSQLPYPDPQRLRMFLDDPHIVAMLPAAAQRDDAVTTGARRAPLSALAHGALAAMPRLLALVVILLLAGWMRHLLRTAGQARPDPDMVSEQQESPTQRGQ